LKESAKFLPNPVWRAPSAVKLATRRLAEAASDGERSTLGDACVVFRRVG